MDDFWREELEHGFDMPCFTAGGIQIPDGMEFMMEDNAGLGVALHDSDSGSDFSEFELLTGQPPSSSERHEGRRRVHQGHQDEDGNYLLPLPLHELRRIAMLCGELERFEQLDPVRDIEVYWKMYEIFRDCIQTPRRRGRGGRGRGRGGGRGRGRGGGVSRQTVQYTVVAQRGHQGSNNGAASSAGGGQNSIANAVWTMEERPNDESRARLWHRQPEFSHADDPKIKPVGHELEELVMKWHNSVIDKLQVSEHRTVLRALDILVGILAERMGSPKDRFEVKPFGSYVTGCMFPDSDLDVSINDARSHPKKTLEACLAVMKEECFHDAWVDVEHVKGARTPIIKAVHKQSGIRVDLSFDNYFAIDNSNLLHEYCYFESQLMPNTHMDNENRCGLIHFICRVIKRWAAQNQLNDPQDGGLSSYTWLNLVVFFMQQLEIVPNLQKPQSDGVHRKVTVNLRNGTTIRYHYNAKVSANAEQIELANAFIDRPVELVRAFFEYYRWFPFELCPVSIAAGEALEKEGIARGSDKFWIQDPFHKKRNLAMFLEHHSGKGRKQLQNALIHACAVFEDEQLTEEQKLVELLGDTDKVSGGGTA
eukprot:gb/GECG01015195.1/.p1 GENE.gb/GECG01015195.1/~~gb/GECG01015195.1/.p1  ORF type:complete len:593 (+),score=78.33 gb/GECG01015195.1/:1-1779(+)